MEPAWFCQTLIIVMVLCFGLSVGSFVNVVIYRLPRDDLAISKPKRSFCPLCGYQIPWYDNLPLLSWVLLRGRCRSCRGPIPVRYVLVELLGCLLSFFIYQTEGLTARYFFYFYFSMCLTAITFIDLELMVIPDLLIWPTAVLGAVNAALTPYPPLAGATLWRFLREGGWNDWAISLFASIAAFILGYLSLKALSVIYKLWRGHKGLGDGDPPLLAVIAMYLGLPAIAPILLLSSMVALISVVALLSAGRFQKQGLALKAIPFGPFLSLAALIWLFFGQKFLTWYFSLLSLPQS